MLSLVVPCFNEEDNVEKFYSQTVMVLGVILMNMNSFLLMTAVRIKHLNDCTAFLIKIKAEFRFCLLAEISAKRLPFMQD